MTMLNPGDSGGRSSGNRVGTVVLVVLLMVVVGGASYAIGAFLGNRSSNSANPDPTSTAGGSVAPTVTPTPCVTVTTIPAKTLPKASSVTVNVYNATTRVGLARRTADTMKARGFVIGDVANDPLGKTVTKPAEVRYGPKGAAAAKLVTFYVPGSVLVKDTRADASVDLVLGTAFKKVASQDAVDTALNKPTLTPGPGCAKPSGDPSVPATIAPTDVPTDTAAPAPSA